MLKIDNITKSFSVGTETRRALDGVSLNVKKGDFITTVSYTHLTLPTIQSV